MRREVTAALTASLVVFGQAAPLLAYTRGGGRGSVSRGIAERQLQPLGQHRLVAGRRRERLRLAHVTQTGERLQRQQAGPDRRAAPRRASTRTSTPQDPSVERTSTATNAWGQSASRERDGRGAGRLRHDRGQREDEHRPRGLRARRVAGRNVYGQPVVAGSVNTKYNGSYAGAAAQQPLRRLEHGDGRARTAARSPRRCPRATRRRTYYGRPYYSYGGAYYRPYTYHGVPYYYPVPPPYYSSYSSPPAGAVMLMVAGVAYLVSQDGSYSKQTTSSEGQVVYQSVPAPAGRQLKTLPAQRVLVTVAGTTYYLYANTFYRRVVSGGQESFVVVTASRRRRVRPRAARGLRGRPAQHACTSRPAGRLLRALPVARRQGAVRAGRPAAAAAGDRSHCRPGASAGAPAPAAATPRAGAGGDGRRVDRRARGDRARGAPGERRELRLGEGGRPLPGVPRPRPRRRRPPRRAPRGAACTASSPPPTPATR